MQRTDQILCQLLTSSKARSALLLGDNAASVVKDLPDVGDMQISTCSWKSMGVGLSSAAMGNELTGLPARNLAQFQVVYLTDLPAALTASPVGSELTQCLSLLRSHCQGELLFEYARRNGHATDNQFYALGFSRALLSAESNGSFAVYRYSLHSYKSAPDWLNSQHWANPERWNLD